MTQIEENITRYLADMDTADRAEPKIAAIQRSWLRGQGRGVENTDAATARRSMLGCVLCGTNRFHRPISDARSMNARGSGIVGYNVQTSVETEESFDRRVRGD